jgi:hypothetical protein
MNTKHTKHFTKTKRDLLSHVDSEDFKCPICLEDIEPDEVIEGRPNCIMCVRGHRCHTKCYEAQIKKPLECPICRSTELPNFCYNRQLGYIYIKKSANKKSAGSCKKIKSRKNNSKYGKVHTHK